MIRQRYQSIYEGTDSELSAKVLLDICLDTLPSRWQHAQDPQDLHPQDLPKMTTEYCSELLERMQNALNRWNEVAESCQRDDILWDAQTINEMKELAANFDTYRETYSEEELCPGLMVERFLRQTLSSVSVAKGVNHYSLDTDCKEIIKGAK